MKPGNRTALGLSIAIIAMAGAAWGAEYNAVMSPDIKWTDAPSIGPGVKTAVIDGDPKSTGPFVIRVRMPPKAKIGVHTHPTDENVTVLDGTLYFAPGDKFEPKSAKAFHAGSYFSIAKGKPMYAYAGDKGAVLQIHGMGPWGISYLETPAAAKKQ